MPFFVKNKILQVKVYHGYGHRDNCIVYGHVFRNKPVKRKNYHAGTLGNILHLLRLFFLRPVANMPIQLQWNDQLLKATTESDGFFKFEWDPGKETVNGWHNVKVVCTDMQGNALASGEGKILIPFSTQYAFISDIDDTVLISHSATIWKRLRVLFTKNPHSRKAFSDVVKHYELLSQAGTQPGVPNPFFYVSSSEWNLYNDLDDFFRHNALPQGIFLLSQVKRWYQLFKTGKTKHEGKLFRIARIMETFTGPRFILLGDNSQKDPEIYASIAKKYPSRIFAVYIRNIVPEHEDNTIEAFISLKEAGVHSYIFKNNADAIAHSRSIGLIN